MAVKRYTIGIDDETDPEVYRALEIALRSRDRGALSIFVRTALRFYLEHGGETVEAKEATPAPKALDPSNFGFNKRS